MAEMKKHMFIKNKVVEHIVKVNIKNATLIPHTHVIESPMKIDDSSKINHAWMVQSQ